MITFVLPIIKRECLLTWRKPAEWINSILFFVIVTILFPLTLIPENLILQTVGPGILWIAVLLAILLSLSQLFQSDYEDGSLELWVLNQYPFSVLIFAKIIVHCLMLCVPVLLVTPILGLMYHLTGHIIKILIITLLLGIPLLSFLGAIGAALVVSLRHSGVLMAMILIPLYIPPLIFATAAISAAASGFSSVASLAWLAALLAPSIIIIPWLAGIILKMGIAFR